MSHIEQCRDAISQLDASNLNSDREDGRNESFIKMKLVPVRAGDEVPLRGLNYGSKTRCDAIRIDVVVSILVNDATILLEG